MDQRNFFGDTNNPSTGEQKTFIHYPLQLKVGGQVYLLNKLNFNSRNFQEICEQVAKEQDALFTFNSSQAPHIFDKIYRITDVFIKDLSEKIDPLLRELVKNAEKENATVIAKRAGLISPDAFHAPLRLQRVILNETLYDPGHIIPLLYYYPEVIVTLRMSVRNNILYFDIENDGTIRDNIREMAEKRIELGRGIALFDLQQEFEMKDYKVLKNKITEFFLLVYSQEKLNELWAKAFEESFDEYWTQCPYFLLIQKKIHSSFFPYFITAYYQLHAAFMKEEHPGEEHFSAGMGFIKCAFVVEANRSLYGTYGKIIAPVSHESKTTAGFLIGMPDIVINFNTIE